MTEEQSLMYRLASVEGMSETEVERVVELSPKLNNPETLTPEEAKFLHKAMDVYIADADALGRKLEEVTMREGASGYHPEAPAVSD
ncbi:MAG: hypothetical protein F6K14_11810 [Symploca sp. SIO2C1]|nr:hypothetical protein [Symploca sp. SIO2C1]